MTIGTLPFIILLNFVVNRFGSLIIYYNVNNTLSRRKLIFEYKYQVKINDI